MKKNGRSPFWWMEISTGPGRVSKTKCGRAVCRSVSQSVSLSVQAFPSIAPDRRSRSGRLRSQKMRQRSGTTMVLVTWRHVSRVTRHVPPREKFEKKSNTATAQTGGWPGAQTFRPEGPWSDLSAMGSNRPGGAKVRPQGALLHFRLLPSSSDTLWASVTKFGTGGDLDTRYPPPQKIWPPKFRGVQFLDFRKIRFWTPRRSKCAGP